MKCLIIFLLPVAFAASVEQKRLVFDTLLNGQEAKNVIDQLVVFLSSDTSEAKCESECHTLIANPQSTIQHLCPFMCHLAQQTLSGLHHTKRLVFDTFLNGEEGRHLIDQLVEQLGTDDNYVKCEQECHVLIRNQQSVMQHLCPFMCHLAIDAIKNLHSPSSNPAGTGAVAKRLVLGNFINTEETSKIIDQLVATLGADESEKTCEAHCHTLILSSTSVFQHMCPFLCHSAQAVINSFGHHSTTTPPAPANPAKRVLLNTFLNNQEVTNIVDQLAVMLTSGTAYGACEKECHVLIRDQTSVVQHLCPFMCHSAQALLGNLHHTTTVAV
uniref:Uncharacterized protein n=6 Tax=Magallana gigas TaxID=29159 RepID=A0A8W8MW25_MAGGI